EGLGGCSSPESTIPLSHVAGELLQGDACVAVGVHGSHHRFGPFRGGLLTQVLIKDASSVAEMRTSPWLSTSAKVAAYSELSGMCHAPSVLGGQEGSRHSTG